jgi:hypothetical protein
MYAVYVRYFWQGNHPIYGHARSIYTDVASPTDLIKEKDPFGTYRIQTTHFVLVSFK